MDPDANSYGAGFAAAGGGVYLAELGDEGVKVWFFSVSFRSEAKARVMGLWVEGICAFFSNERCGEHRYGQPGYPCGILPQLGM